MRPVAACLDSAGLHFQGHLAQVLDRVRKEASEAFRSQHRGELQALASRVEKVAELREGLSFGTSEERREFLAWFEPWFLRRADPVSAPKS